MGYDDFVQNFNEIFVSYDQSSRTGGHSHPQWQPRVDMGFTRNEEMAFLRVDICKDIDLTKDIFALQVWQKGNRMGTNREEIRYNSAFFDTSMVRIDGGAKWKRRWFKGGALKPRWNNDVSMIIGDGPGDAISNKLKTGEVATDKTKKEDMSKSTIIPAGTYMIHVRPKWVCLEGPTKRVCTEEEEKARPEFSWVMGLSSPSPVTISKMDDAEGWANMADGHATLEGKNMECRKPMMDFGYKWTKGPDPKGYWLMKRQYTELSEVAQLAKEKECDRFSWT